MADEVPAGTSATVDVTTKPPEATTFHRTYPGTKDQVRIVREHLASLIEGCPFADEFVLIASELSANAVMHSRSGKPGGTFTVRAEVFPGDFAWLEVEDQGGPPTEREAGDEDERGRGLAIVAALAGEGNWVIEDGSAPGTRVAWAWLNWRRDDDSQDQGRAS
jgi:anti-sigma regulatory factor (Ser/Thr protein kinase)